MSEGPAPAVDFSSVMSSISGEMASKVSTPESTPVVTTSPAPESAPVTPPPSSPAVSTSDSPSPSLVSSGQAGSPGPASSPSTPQPDYMKQLLDQQAEFNKQLIALNTPKPPPVEPPKPVLPPTTAELMRSFVEPRAQQGESPQELAARTQLAAYDHLEQKRHEWRQEQISSHTKQQISEYHQQQTQMVQQQHWMQQAEQNYGRMLDGAVQAAGYNPTTPTGQFVRDQVHKAMLVEMNAGRTQKWDSAAWQQKFTETVGQFKSHMPVAAPAAPNTSTGPAPISGGAATASPSTPATKSAAKAGSFQEAMKNMSASLQQTHR